jgi:hypothetical protein
MPCGLKAEPEAARVGGIIEFLESPLPRDGLVFTHTGVSGYFGG